MIERLSGQGADRDASSAVCRGVVEHLEKERLWEVKAAAGSVKQPARREETHRTQIDVLVSPQRAGHRRPRLGESGRIEHDRVERDSFALFLPQVVEGVRFYERDVVE